MIGRVLFTISALALVAAKPADPPAKPMLSVIAPAEVANDPSNKLILELSTGGRVVIMMRPDAAPEMVGRVKTLVRQGFYNGLIFHRVVPGFMAQGGDPTGKGDGGSPLPDLKAEFNSLPFLRGTVGAARTDKPDTGNSQFFIMFAPNATLNERYTAFGRVIEGMQAVDTIAPGEPPEQPTKIVRATLGG
ncbi:peptidylprolyl isomerase [Sphingomonas sediminicola]|jgi:peptidylprolyl isomerase|uniref:Peptidyl-prolyl cis-trans isomerase n=1 Tax=Sphingomonas sediminicola TaxID=386874 RepID=A0ABX6T948_9SPHN|nr:peptidylprolyl isomerase [Sphingomonas sediminicola]QNP46384.1 peptidylprolyl isomerase [Sphingomonas sediminicola]